MFTCSRPYKLYADHYFLFFKMFVIQNDSHNVPNLLCDLFILSYSFIYLIYHINSDHGVICTILLITINRLKKKVQFCDLSIHVYFGN